LCSENVTTYCGAELTQLTARGFLDPQGNEIEVDAIVLATGFNTTWVPRFPIIANGRNLQDIYKSTRAPLSYLGVSTPYIPNYFSFYGPYSPIGQGSVLAMMDVFAKYMIQMIQKIQIEDIISVVPKVEVVEAYGEHTRLLVRRYVWDSPCRSWMKAGDLNGSPSSYAGTRAQA
jgi:cation diffusion facilitator CzcD-associated flavoprotein CzcO